MQWSSIRSVYLVSPRSAGEIDLWSLPEDLRSGAVLGRRVGLLSKLRNGLCLVLQGGRCATESCSGSGALDSLGGICFSKVVTSQPSAIDGNVTSSSTERRGLSLWQYLVIGGAVIALLAAALLLWRWRARKRRAAETKLFKERLERGGISSRVSVLWGRVFGWRNADSAAAKERRERLRTQLRFAKTSAEDQGQHYGSDLESGQEKLPVDQPSDVAGWRAGVLSPGARRRVPQTPRSYISDISDIPASTKVYEGSGPDEASRRARLQLQAATDPWLSVSGRRSPTADTGSVYSTVTMSAGGKRHVPTPKQPLKDSLFDVALMQGAQARLPSIRYPPAQTLPAPTNEPQPALSQHPFLMNAPPQVLSQTALPASSKGGRSGSSSGLFDSSASTSSSPASRAASPIVSAPAVAAPAPPVRSATSSSNSLAAHLNTTNGSHANGASEHPQPSPMPVPPPSQFQFQPRRRFSSRAMAAALKAASDAAAQQSKMNPKDGAVGAEAGAGAAPSTASSSTVTSTGPPIGSSFSYAPLPDDYFCREAEYDYLAAQDYMNSMDVENEAEECQVEEAPTPDYMGTGTPIITPRLLAKVLQAKALGLPLQVNNSNGYLGLHPSHMRKARKEKKRKSKKEKGGNDENSNGKYGKGKAKEKEKEKDKESAKPKKSASSIRGDSLTPSTISNDQGRRKSKSEGSIAGSKRSRDDFEDDFDMHDHDPLQKRKKGPYSDASSTPTATEPAVKRPKGWKGWALVEVSSSEDEATILYDEDGHRIKSKSAEAESGGEDNDSEEDSEMEKVKAKPGWKGWALVKDPPDRSKLIKLDAPPLVLTTRSTRSGRTFGDANWDETIMGQSDIPSTSRPHAEGSQGSRRGSRLSISSRMS
ncbi:hypothetical protein FRB99_002701 [Tulasnella sp. 403]|nr:hypothetical protein FRB99_002701 [Tulasnella sp. 403]